MGEEAARTGDSGVMIVVRGLSPHSGGECQNYARLSSRFDLFAVIKTASV